MSSTWQYYVITLVVFFGCDLMAGWSLNLQYGVTGILNFSFIMFEAVGAYIASVTALGPSSATSWQHYVLGASLPFPFPILFGAAAGALVALVVGVFALRPIGRSFQAMVLLIVSVIASTAVTAEPSWFNGAQGLAAIPKPLQGTLGLSFVGYGWFFVGLTACFVGIVFLVVHRITSSPYGRRLRAVRENPRSAAAIGVDVRKETLAVFMVGGAIAATAGALVAEFIGAYAPSQWSTLETFLFLAALTVGGTANNAGVALGIAVVLTGFLRGVQYLPAISYSSTTGAGELITIAVLLVGFLWFRPQGLLPERRRRLAAAAVAAGPAPTVADPVRGALPSPVTRSETEPILRVTDLRRSFGGVVAVDGATFTIPEAQITGLIGPNGAGKSTVLNLIAGVERPQGGRVAFRGTDVTGLPPHRLARLGVVRTFQLSNEFGRLTVLENLLAAVRDQKGAGLPGALLGKRHWRDDEREHLRRARALLERFELDHAMDTWASELSGGQKRLLEIARALMTEPELLLLDEPFAGIGPRVGRDVENHLMALRNEGLAIVMVEHELDAVDRCTDSVIVMALGRIVAQGTLQDVRTNEEVLDAYLVG
jgi:ABC-type branched-subunit amino acid transport system ATPase component/ABC-type branched-subunit amino acid transport system permease subunit